MATTNNDAIQKLYVAYFNRPADPAGLAFWASNVGADGDTSAIAAAFATTPEYTATFSGMTNAQIVAAVYQNLFGRAADAEGAAFWTAALDANTITVDNVVTSVAAGAQGTDSTIVANKVTAANAFTAAVDTQTEIAGYAGTSANAAAKTWLSGVTDANSLSAALTPSSLATTVANVVAAGTTFSVTGSLAALDQAKTALTNWVQSVDVDSDASTTTTVADITNAYYNSANGGSGALKDVADLLTSGSNAQTLFVASTTTDAVRASLLSAQESINSANLATAQGQLSAANTAISKVAGLTAAVATLSAATTAEAAANKALIAANADQAAKEKGFEVTFDGDVAINTTDKTLVLTPTDTSEPAVVLGTVDANGKITVTTDKTVVSSHAGLTDLIASYNAQLAATSTVTSAHNTTAAAQHAVDNLDVDMTQIGNASSEAGQLSAVTAAINTYAAQHPESNLAIAAGTYASEAQIQTAKAVINTPEFTSLVSGYETVAAASNPLSDAQTAANTAVENAQDTITDLTDAVAAMQAAQANVNTLAGYQATVTADEKVLTSHGYNLVEIGATANNGTAASDIFTIGTTTPTTTAGATINLFGTQGADSLFVGSNYKLVQGAIGGTDVKGDSAALEVFVSNVNGGAQLQVETHAYSSNFPTSTGEVITITLAGVDASTLHIDNGIITSGTATTTA